MQSVTSATIVAPTARANSVTLFELGRQIEMGCDDLQSGQRDLLLRSGVRAEQRCRGRRRGRCVGPGNGYGRSDASG